MSVWEEASYIIAKVKEKISSTENAIKNVMPDKNKVQTMYDDIRSSSHGLSAIKNAVPDKTQVKSIYDATTGVNTIASVKNLINSKSTDMSNQIKRFSKENFVLDGRLEMRKIAIDLPAVSYGTSQEGWDHGRFIGTIMSPCRIVSIFLTPTEHYSPWALRVYDTAYGNNPKYTLEMGSWGTSEGIVSEDPNAILLKSPIKNPSPMELAHVKAHSADLDLTSFEDYGRMDILYPGATTKIDYGKGYYKGGNVQQFEVGRRVMYGVGSNGEPDGDYVTLAELTFDEALVSTGGSRYVQLFAVNRNPSGSGMGSTNVTIHLRGCVLLVVD